MKSPQRSASERQSNGFKRILGSFSNRVFGKRSFIRNKRTRQNNDLQFQIEKLEPRMMLNGDTGDLVFNANFEDANVPAGEFAFFRTVSGLTATTNLVEVQNNHIAVGPASQGDKLLELDGTNGVFVNISNVPSEGLILQGDYSARKGFNQTQNYDRSRLEWIGSRNACGRWPRIEVNEL